MAFTVMTMRPSNNQQFIIQSDMQRGDMVIFDTLNTPHTAVSAPRPEAEKDLPRTSIEIRAFILKNSGQYRTPNFVHDLLDFHDRYLNDPR